MAMPPVKWHYIFKTTPNPVLPTPTFLWEKSEPTPFLEELKTPSTFLFLKGGVLQLCELNWTLLKG